MIVTHRRYIILLAATAFTSWTGWVLVLQKLDPCITPGEVLICAETSSLAMILFFVSLFFALTTTFSVFVYFIRLWFHRHDIVLNDLNVALRQGLLLAFVVIGSLGMLALSVLRWWSGLLLLSIALLLELYFTRSV